MRLEIYESSNVGVLRLGQLSTNIIAILYEYLKSLRLIMSSIRHLSARGRPILLYSMIVDLL